MTLRRTVALVAASLLVLILGGLYFASAIVRPRRRDIMQQRAEAQGFLPDITVQQLADRIRAGTADRILATADMYAKRYDMQDARTLIYAGIDRLSSGANPTLAAGFVNEFGLRGELCIVTAVSARDTRSDIMLELLHRFDARYPREAPDDPSDCSLFLVLDQRAADAFDLAMKYNTWTPRDTKVALECTAAMAEHGCLRSTCSLRSIARDFPDYHYHLTEAENLQVRALLAKAEQSE